MDINKKIHPFPNGKGRHSRLLADVIAEKIFNKSVFSWGKDNISKPGDTKFIDDNCFYVFPGIKNC